MKLQVLIADADPDFQRTMTQALSREGDMEAAGVSSDGLETLSLIQTARPDVVLLDLIQQRLDGLAILRRLAGREDAPPVLVLTGFVNAAVVAECAKLGAAYFIPKPCDTAATRTCRKRSSAVPSPAALADPRTANSSLRSPSLFSSRSANKKYGILPENRTASAADRPQTGSPWENIHALLSAK